MIIIFYFLIVFMKGFCCWKLLFVWLDWNGGIPGLSAHTLLWQHEQRHIRAGDRAERATDRYCEPRLAVRVSPARRHHCGLRGQADSPSGLCGLPSCGPASWVLCRWVRQQVSAAAGDRDQSGPGCGLHTTEQTNCSRRGRTIFRVVRNVSGNYFYTPNLLNLVHENSLFVIYYFLFNHWR